MAEITKIQWCDHTFNPWRGCTKVSPGCAHCYAETLSKRNPAVLGEWGPNGTRVIAAEAQWRLPQKWNDRIEAEIVANATKDWRDRTPNPPRERVFCASLADIFEDRPELEKPRLRLFDLIERTPHLDWLILTKRTAFMAEFFARRDVPSNVWLGTSVEDQTRADERVEILLGVKARIRFLSAEPQLGPIVFEHRFSDGSIRNWLTGQFRNMPCKGVNGNPDFTVKTDDAKLPRIHWVIIGGESGGDARPFNLEWARMGVEQCRRAKTACFMKQLGRFVEANYYDDVRNWWEGNQGNDWPHAIDWNYRDGQPPIGSRVRLPLVDCKGGEPSEWPDDLRVREFPHA